MERDLMMF